MKFAVIQVRTFALQALRRTEPGLAVQPLALIEGVGRKAVVTQVSGEAVGVEAGMGAPLAMARCPGVLLRMRSALAETEAQAILLAAAFSLSPRVESTAGGICTVDLQGAKKEDTRRRAEALIVDLAAGGLAAIVGIGRTPLLASYAAGSLPAPTGGIAIMEDERAFLDLLPLAVAEPVPAHADLLARWGIRTLGALTAIGKADLGRRLGGEGVALWERAAGETVRVLNLAKLPDMFAAEWNLPAPVEVLEPLLFILRRLVDRLVLELRGAGFVARGLTLELGLDDGTACLRELSLPEPSGDGERLFRVLHTHLEQVRTVSPVKGLRLTVIPTRPLVKQPGLFDTGLKDPHGFAESLARVAALVGTENVGTPEPMATHRPDSFRLTSPVELIPPPAAASVHSPHGLVLRRFRPAWPVHVELAGQQPCRIAGTQMRGLVTASRGPWRESGDWWRELSWARETWQIELADGGIYQLVHGADGWAVEGIWD
jgi:protein ImuB